MSNKIEVSDETELLNIITSSEPDKNATYHISQITSGVIRKYLFFLSKINLKVETIKISYINLNREKKININYAFDDLFSSDMFNKIFTPKFHEEEIFYCELSNYSELSFHPYYNHIHYASLEMIFQPVIAIEASGTLIYANNQAQDLFSLTPKKILRKKTKIQNLIQIEGEEEIIRKGIVSEKYQNNYTEVNYTNLVNQSPSRMRIGINQDHFHPQHIHNNHFIIYLYPVDIEEMLQEKYQTKQSEVQNLQIESEIKENKILSLTSEALTDALTGLNNKRAYNQLCQSLLDSQNFESLALVIIDFDHFKSINDTYGHQVGDIVLQEFAKIAKESKRPSDFVCRWGGEEFLFLLKDPKSGEGLKVFCERLRKRCEETKINALGEEISFTASIGGTMIFSEHLKDLNSFGTALEKADKALYFCKRNGRNQVLILSLYEEMEISHQYQNSLFFDSIDEDSLLQKLIYRLEHSFVTTNKNLVRLNPYYSFSAKSDEYIDKVLTFKPNLTCNFKSGESNEIGINDLISFLENQDHQDFIQCDTEKPLDEINQEINNEFEKHSYPSHVREIFLLLLDELISNATFNAPIDREGRSLYKNLGRSKSLTNINQSIPYSMKYNFKKEKIILEVTDYYGSLQIEDLNKYMFEKKSSQKLKQEGGAGIGLHLLLQHSDQFCIRILKNKSTTFRCILYPKSKNKEFQNGFRSFTLVSN